MSALDTPLPPWSPSSPAGPWDYVVIGSGIGGMATAALLAKAGRRTLVLERHRIPGGFTHAFRRRGYEFDVGLHLVGEAAHRFEMGRLLEYLSDGSLEWASVGPVYDEFDFPGDFHLGFPSDPDQFRELLVRTFPGEQEAIHRYLQLVRDARFAVRDYLLARALPLRFAPVVDHLVWRRAHRYYGQTTGAVLDTLGASDRLLRVLTAQWGYYGASPRRSSFAQHAIVTRHYLRGAYYPVGGAKRIAEGLLGAVAAAGGWTRTEAAVEQIVIHRGKAVGVRLAGGEQVRARRVVSAVGVGSTVRRLLPPEVRDAPWARAVRELEPSPAHSALYLGFKGDIASAGAGRSNRWLYNTWNRDVEAWDISNPNERLGPPPMLYCSFASLKDPAHDPGPEQRHSGQVIAFTPWRSFAAWRDLAWRQRGPDYEDLKARIKDRMLDELFGRLPGLAALLDYAELSTPLSTDTFCAPVEGGIYGILPTPARFACRWLRPRSPIDGLYFSGADVASPGIVGALAGGVLGALAAEPLGTLAQVRHLRA